MKSVYQSGYHVKSLFIRIRVTLNIFNNSSLTDITRQNGFTVQVKYSLILTVNSATYVRGEVGNIIIIIIIIIIITIIIIIIITITTTSSTTTTAIIIIMTRRRTILLVFLIMLQKHFLAVSTEEQMIADAINKQKNEVNRRQEEVMNLLDSIVEVIEKCSGR